MQDILSSLACVIESGTQADDFDLSFNAKELILRDLVYGIRGLKPLIVTGGTHYGIMKLYSFPAMRLLRCR